MEKERHYVGMDLGTFKTSVSSSAGIRDVLVSAVGWPKDDLARTVLGRDVVFGKDIAEQRLALQVVRPFEKGTLKYNKPEGGVKPEVIQKQKEAAHLLVEQAVSLTRPPKGVPIYGVIGAPSRASVGNKKIILEAAEGVFHSVLIVSEPFTIAYGMNRLNDTLVIDIGAGTTDLCPIWGTFPQEEDQVTIPIGGDFIDEYFYRAVRSLYPEAQLSLDKAREIKEKFGFVHDGNEKAVVTLLVHGKPKALDVTEPLKAACRTIVPPILEALNELILRFDPDFQQRLLQNIILGGGGSQLRGLDRVIEEALKEYGGARVTKVGDAVFAGAAGALKLAMNTPAEGWQRLHQYSSAEGTPSKRSATWPWRT